MLLICLHASQSTSRITGRADDRHLVLVRFHLWETEKENKMRGGGRKRDGEGGKETFWRTRYYLSCQRNLFWIGFQIEWERKREVGREKIEWVREWWRWPLLLSTLIAALMPVMLRCQHRQRGIGWRWWNKLRGFPVPASLALAQQKALCTTTQLLLLSQRHSRRRGSSWVGRPWAGLTGGGEWEEEFGRRKGVGCWVWDYGRTHLIGLVNGEETVGKSCWGLEWEGGCVEADFGPTGSVALSVSTKGIWVDIASIWRRPGM